MKKRYKWDSFWEAWISAKAGLYEAILSGDILEPRKKGR